MHGHILAADPEKPMPATQRQEIAVRYLLDGAAEAFERGDWGTGVGLAEAALTLAPGSVDAARLLAEAQLKSEPRRREVGARRRMTVMFCDLVDSTRLATRFDPEETREVLRAYQQACGAAIARYDGHVAHVVGDGLLVYFGHPRAHEDDAVRAVLAGLAIVEAVAGLRFPWAGDQLRLAVRIGVHTGMAVIAEMGVGMWAQADDVVGETPNMAARIHSKARPNSVLISKETLELVQGRVEVVPLEPQVLKGIPRPAELYEVVSERRTESRFQAVSTGTSPLAGRREELRAIEEAWQSAREGVQGLLLVGEPGIGKSRLAAHATSHVEADGGRRLTLQCSPYHKGSPLYPVIHCLRHELDREEPESSHFDHVERLSACFGLDDPEALFALTTLLSVPWPSETPAPALPPQRLRERTFAMLLSWIDQLATRTPLLLVTEDLHWADPSTLELLRRILERSPAAPLLALMTSREQPPVRFGARCRTVELAPLAASDCGKIVDDLTASTPLPPSMRRLIIERSDGVPLFVEELTRMLADPSAWPGGSAQAGSGVPHTLRDLLVARLDTFPDELELAQAIATIGQPASLDLLLRLFDGEESELRRQLAALTGARLLRLSSKDPPAYEFGHALVRDAAYELQLRARQREVHAKVAKALADQFQGVGEEHPEVLAYHFEHAGELDVAAEHWLGAARRHAMVAAHEEAIQHFRRALAVTASRPSPCPGFELDARSGLAASLLAARGYTAEEVAEAYAQVRGLSAVASGRGHAFPSVYGLWAYYHVRGQNTVSCELAERLVTAASGSDDSADMLAAYAVLGYQHLYIGRPVSACQLLEGARHWNGPPEACPLPHHPGIGATVNLALALWLIGRPGAARRAVAEAIAAAEALTGPIAEFTRAYTHAFASGLFHAIEEPATAAEHANRAMQISHQHGFASWFGAGAINQTIANALTGDAAEFIPAIESGLAAWRDAGAESNRTQFLLGLARAHRRAGQPRRALAIVDEALAHAEATGERFAEADLLCLRGELLAGQEPPDPDAAMAAFDAAVTVARRQQARAVELRALTSRQAFLDRLGVRSNVTDLRQLLASFERIGEVAEPYVEAARSALTRGERTG